jgi:cytidine deaminase
MPDSLPAPEAVEAQQAELAVRAAQARQWSYSPYSGYAVGAAILAASGKIYDGTNVENAAYPTSLCAERVAAVKAVSEGEREFTAIAVSTANGGMPCGACRQFLSEFGLDAVVLIVGPQGALIKQTTVRELLPDAFGPAQIK